VPILFHVRSERTVVPTVSICREQPTKDRDIPVASFSGNGGHREHDCCLRRQQDKISSCRNRPNTGFLALIQCFPKSNTAFMTFPTYSQGQDFFSDFFRQCRDFFEAIELTVTVTKATQRTVRYRDRCSPTHGDSTRCGGKMLSVHVPLTRRGAPLCGRHVRMRGRGACPTLGSLLLPQKL
jgi:hypothetical protein